MEQRWATVDRDELSEARVERIGDADVVVYASPYDIPALIGIGVDTSAKTLSFVFGYVTGGSEPARLEKIGQNIVATVGKHSGRIHTIGLGPEQWLGKKGNEVITTVVDALKDAKGLGKADQSRQSRLALRALEVSQKAVLAILARIAKDQEGVAKGIA